MEKMKRTCTCGELNKNNLAEKVTLNGWVHRHRDHGNIKFINLRDRYGITQVVIDADASPELKNTASELKFEYCIAVQGEVRSRPDNMVNPAMQTGEIEVKAENIQILSPCAALPFMIDERTEAREDLRLQYRYLDLRSFSMQKNIRLRHEVALGVREYLIGRGFIEIETPTLIRSTPEGARDFLVPSRLHSGKFYALPQSPQLYKQLLMVSGFDKYFQIAHCFRDEDARGNRQIEHTQIDLEMSFVSKEDVFEVIEGMLQHVFRKTLSKELKIPFPRLSHDQAMNRYGSDKPDLRFHLEIKDMSSMLAQGDFQLFNDVVGAGGVVKALVAPGCSDFSRKEISRLEETARIFKAKGLAWMKVTEEGLEGGISRFYSNLSEAIITKTGAEPGDLLLFVGDTWKTACTSLGAVRNELAAKLKLYDEKDFNFAWIIDFPLFEWSEEEKCWEPAHHMFSRPQEQYLDTLEENPGRVKGDLYDLVCNGVELASGSIRIHDPELQKRIFNIIGLSLEEAGRRFGFLLEAFKYGAPPHGGIAPGLDRLVMLMAGESTIREVITFPKNTLGLSPMDDSPSPVGREQLEELHLKITESAP
ncbi:Aspartate--tRNA ligase [subsurface metagenome]